MGVPTSTVEDRTGRPAGRPTLGAEATLFASLDDGETFERMTYPGEPREAVLAWAADRDRVFGGV